MRRRYQRGPSSIVAFGGPGSGAGGGPDGDEVTVEAIRPSYGSAPWRHWQPLTDAAVVGAAATVFAAAVGARWSIGVAAGVAVAGLVHAIDLDTRRWMLVLIVLLGALAGGRADRGMQQSIPVTAGPVHAWATVIGDPREHDRVTRVVLRLDTAPPGGSRVETWVRGSEQRESVAGLRHGDRVLVSGEARPLEVERARRIRWQHVVGELRRPQFHAVGPAAPVDRFSATVRRAVERGSAQLDPPHDALLRGLVIGDRRGQPTELVERFRRSGLSHLTVASGLNVALLLTAASPVLTRLRPWSRWLATLVLVAWFASLTRFEPSILRASVMAAIAATAFLSGRDRSPVRLLALAVVVLVLVDPFLVRSLGFRLSVGATWGVAALGPRIAARLPGPAWIGRPLGVTLGAQAGVAVPLLSGVGHVPVVSVPANLLAVPVAGLVKLYGLPASIVAGTVPAIDGVVMAPCRLGVSWVDRVASIAADLEPAPNWALAWWLAIAVVVGVVVMRSGR